MDQHTGGAEPSTVVCGAVADRQPVERLVRTLLAFAVPPRLVGKETPAGVVPKQFDGITSLLFAPEGTFTDDARRQIDRATVVIVACSPDAATSAPLDEAIRHYRRDPDARLLCYILSGEPNASDRPEQIEAECFPRAVRYEIDAAGELRDERVEPIAADARPGADGVADARLKLVAGLLQVTYDDLKQRDVLRRQARMRRIAGVSIALLIGAVVLIVNAMRTRAEADYQRGRAVDATTEARNQEQRALEGERQSRRSLYDAYVRRGWEAERSGDAAANLLWQVEALALIEDAPTPDSDDPARRHDQRVRIDHLLGARRLTPEVACFFDGQAVQAALSPDDASILVLAGRTLYVFDARSGEPRFAPVLHESELSWSGYDGSGRRVAVIETDGRAHVYDASTGERVAGPLHHPKKTSDILFHPSADLVYTTCEDGRARAWNLEAPNEPVFELEHDDRVYAVAVSADGRRMATSCLDGTVRVWDARTGAPLTKPLTSWKPMVVRLDATGERLLVIGNKTLSVELWDVERGTLLARLAHDFAVYQARFSPDGSLVATVGEDRRLRLWEAKTGAPSGRPLGMDAGIAAVAFSPDGKRVATGSREGRVVVFDVAARTLEIAPLSHHGEVVHVWFDATGTKLMASGKETAAFIWDVEPAARPKKALGDDVGSVRYMAYLPRTERLVTLDVEGRVVWWNASTGRVLGRSDALAGEHPMGAVACGDAAAIVLTKSSVARLDPETGALRRYDLPSAVDAGTVASVQTDRAGSRALVIHKGGSIVIDTATGRTLASHRRSLDPDATSALERSMLEALPWRMAALNPDGTLFVQGANDSGSARVLRVADGQPATPLLARDDDWMPMLWAVFDETGQRFLTFGVKARIWRTETGEAVTAPFEHGVMVHAAFTRSGEHVLTASLRGDVILWDAATGRPLTSPRRHVADALVFAELDADERWVATVSADGAALVQELETGQPLTTPLLPEGVVVESARFDVGRRTDAMSSGMGKYNCCFTAGRDALFVLTAKGELLRWLLTPTRLRLDELRTTAQLAAHREIDASGTVRAIGGEHWRERWRRWAARGGGR